MKKKFSDNRLTKILFLPVDRGGCGWYRVRNFYKEVENQGLADALLLEADNQSDLDSMGRAAEVADIVYARPNGVRYVSALRDIDKKKKIVMDVDDNTFLTDPASDSYRYAGFEEVKVGEQWMWKQGVEDFDMFRNRIAAINLERALSYSNLITSPSVKLAGEFAKYNGGVSGVVPNFIRFAQWDNVDVGTSGEFRIGWSGGASHPLDFRETAEPIKEFLKKHSDARLHLAGDSWGFQWKGVENQVVKHEWVEFEAHMFRLKCLQLDMAIIPLQDIPFNTYKSEVKFSEFSAIKVPSLVKDIEPYNLYAEHNKNAILYKDDKDFAEKLEWMYKDKKTRDKIARNAYDWVKQERDIKTNISKVVDIWKSVL